MSVGYGNDKMLRADLVLARTKNEKPVKILQEGKCIQVEFPPGENTLKKGLDHETLLFYTKECADIYYGEIIAL